jgi:N-methylhydantoinase A
MAFAAGTMALDTGRAGQAVMGAVGTGLDLSVEQASHGIAEMVEENMANAARRHAAESGKTIEERSLIAFGGSAPLHAARLAEKLGIADVIVPPHAGVGSAVGFLRAPVSFEVVRSHVAPLSGLDCAAFEAMLAEMSESALAVVRLGAPTGPVAESGTVSMRYVGQGHEFEVTLPPRPFTEAARGALREAFVERYIQLFGAEIPHQDLEIVDIALRAQAASRLVDQPGERLPPEPYRVEPHATRTAFDTATRGMIEMPAYDRARLSPGARLEGPAIIYEAETTTVVTASFLAEIDASRAIRLRRKELPA